MSPTNILSFSVEQFRTPHVVYNSISASLFFLLLSNQPNLETAWTRYKDHEKKYFRSCTAQLSLSWEISFRLICVTRLLIHTRVKEISNERANLIVETAPTPDTSRTISWQIWISDRRSAEHLNYPIISSRMLNLGSQGMLKRAN